MKKAKSVKEEYDPVARRAAQKQMPKPSQEYQIVGLYSHPFSYGLGNFWKEIFPKVLEKRASCGCSLVSPHLMIKGTQMEKLETRYMFPGEHACTPVCIQLEFINFICKSYFNNEHIFNSTNSTQGTQKSIWCLKVICANTYPN